MQGRLLLVPPGLMPAASTVLSAAEHGAAIDRAGSQQSSIWSDASAYCRVAGYAGMSRPAMIEEPADTET